MLRWHLQEGRSAIPKSTKPDRIAENFDVFDFELSSDQIVAIDALDTGVRSGTGNSRGRSRRPEPLRRCLVKRLVTGVVFIAVAQVMSLAQGAVSKSTVKKWPRTTTSCSVRLTNTPGLAPRT